MEKKVVSHYDEDGISCEMELLEGEVIKYFPQEDRKYGFVKLGNGTTLFFHLNNRSSMDGYGVEKLRYIPRFHTRYGRLGQVLRAPEQGDKILFVIGKDKKGRPCVDAWTYPSEYGEALKLCDAYRTLEAERIQCNPNFKCLEIVRRSGQTSAPSARFQGTKQEFERTFPFRGKFNTSDTLLSQQFGDLKYQRWFERETLTGWEPCEDPRTIRLHLNIDKARELLWACDRTVNTNTWEVKWNAQTRHLMFVIDNTHPLIAIGEASGNVRQIHFLESPDYLETTFVSGNSRFEDLWKAGHNAPSLIDSMG
jgi:hypothetical protein